MHSLGLAFSRSHKEKKMAFKTRITFANHVTMFSECQLALVKAKKYLRGDYCVQRMASK